MNYRRRQRGTVLIVALIMLTAATSIALSNFELGKHNLQIMANAELDQQTFAATQAAVEEAIGSSRIFRGLPVFLCYNISNKNCQNMPDGRIAVTLSAGCVRVAPLRSDDLDATNPREQGCFVGASQQGAVDGSGAASLCSRSVWDIFAVGDYEQTGARGAQARVRQGIGVTVANTNIATLCP